MNLLIFLLTLALTSSETGLIITNDVTSNFSVTSLRYEESIDPGESSVIIKSLPRQDLDFIRLIINDGGTLRHLYIHLQTQNSSEEDFSHNSMPFIKIVLYSFISVTLTNLCALFGFAIMFFQRCRFYQGLLVLLSSLGIGALMASAIMVLIPDSIPMSEMPLSLGGGKDRLYLNKMTVACVGVLFCIFVEFAIYGITKSKHSHTHHGCLEEDVPIKDFSDNKGDSNVGVRKIAENQHLSLKQKLLKPVVLMIIIGDGVHNFMDGVGIASAFTQSFSSGISLSISVFMEELPHELGDFGILLISGLNVKECLVMNGLSACSAYLGMILGLTIGQLGEGSNYVMAFTGGLFLYISLCGMLPELMEKIQLSGNRLVNFFILTFGIVFGSACIFGVTKASEYFNIL